MHLTEKVEDRIAGIEGSKIYFAWDGCHKIYLTPAAEEINDAIATGYDIYPPDYIRKAWTESCPLVFVSKWGMTDGEWGHEFAIGQFEGVEDDETDDTEDEDED